jgi:hypothetical protein
LIAILAERLFRAVDEASLALLAILELGVDGRHVFLTNPLWKDSNVVGDWLKALPRRLRLEAENVLARGVDASSQLPASRRRIRIDDVPQCEWDRPVPVLPTTTALRLLRTPLRLLVENRVNDGAFVRKIAPPTLRQDLDAALDRGWVEFEHGGGIDQMRGRVEEAKRDPATSARMWVMFDSDGRFRGDRSSSATKIAELCRNVAQPWPLPHHPLERRSIENYLPLEALAGGAHKLEQRLNEDETRDYRALIDVFKRELTEEQRHYFNMKAGLLGDVTDGKKHWNYRKTGGAIDDGDIPKIFRGFDFRTKEILRHGFGGRVADLFHDQENVQPVQEAALARTVPQNERNALLQSLFEGM